MELFSEPMIALLVAAALIYMVLGDLGEGLTLAVFVLAVIALTLYQEGKSESSIEALREMTQPLAQVSRDGQRRSIASRDVVCGDVLHLSEGDRVAADAQVLWSDNLQVDESLLTGESVAVSKEGDSTQRVFGGTHVIRGQAVVQVTATGPRSEMGRIGAALASLETAPSPLHRQTARLVRIIATVALVLCTTLVIVQGLRTGDGLAALLAGIALAMGILPEEYPVVLALFPALGAHRLARQGVLTRRLNAIETLGATTVLCTDKTGTLTENRMQVALLAVGDAEHPMWHDLSGSQSRELPNLFHPVIEHAILASAPQPFDPMEQAFHRLGNTSLAHTDHQHNDWTLVQTYALSPQLRAMAHVWRHAQGTQEGVAHAQTYGVSTKGAPEAVMSLCHLDAATQAHWMRAVERMAAQGLRVLAVAHGFAQGPVQATDQATDQATTSATTPGMWPASPHDFDIHWLGLIGLRDPLRPDIAQAMAQAQSAGIRVLMITGDYPVTAQVIADQAGMAPGGTLAGHELDLLSDDELRLALRQTRVCARISPQQKLRIVQCLKADGEIVTMTGDGVNDAPALKAAHVGIAMGQRGTDVAREAADLVLVDDNFASIVRGIRLGRRIFGNLQKSMQYIFAIHIPIAGMALVPMLMGWPSLMLPLHVALLELVIDPACSLAFENEPAPEKVMQQPPRDTRAALFGAQAIGLALGQGLCVLACVGLTFYLAKHWPSASAAAWSMPWTAPHDSAPFAAALSEAQTRAMLFVTLITGNAALILSNRAGAWQFWRSLRTPNAVAYAVIALAGFFLAVAIHWPWLAGPLQFEPLPLWPLLMALASGLLSGVGISVLHGVMSAWQRQPKGHR
jgi:Ca2+-transporting ATPase